MSEKSSFESKTRTPLQRRRLAGMVLLLVAVLALAGRHLDFSLGESLTLVVGLAFLGWSIWGREWGLLVPGGIITGVGLGILVRSNGGGNAGFLYCLALGFGSITLLSQLIFRRREWWPLIPAAAIAFAALMSDRRDPMRQVIVEMRPYWPFAAIAVALFLLFTKPRGGN